jgi:4-hydroxy-3-methylbut-2-en-1-yl diphosphate reductase
VITAGASAPEVVVEECIDYLKQHFNAEFSEETLREENVHFNLPKELATLTTPTPTTPGDAS